jgi:hypothetical protein
MREEKFLYFVNYAIDKYNGKMTVFYKDKPLKTIIIHKNMNYNPENEELAYQIALESDLAKDLIKGEL